MLNDPERSARIIENRMAGDDSNSDEALGTLAFEVRTMQPNSIAIASWVRFQSRLKQIDSTTLEAIALAITDGVPAE